MPKYFYVCTDFDTDFWVNAEGYLKNFLQCAQYIGGEYWPYTRREARLQPTGTILQFERDTLKFVKVIK